MKLVIFGSREFSTANAKLSYEESKKKLSKEEMEVLESFIEEVDRAIKTNNLEVSEVVCGEAAGADALGKLWAQKNNIPVKSFPANWNDINVPGAVVLTNKWGKQYNKLAGIQRNKDMHDYADAGLAMTKGTPGTNNMISNYKKSGKPIYYSQNENYVEF